MENVTSESAPHLGARRLLIDLETPFPRRWFGGDAFRSAYFNALSMSFPIGEQFFIDAVRGVLPRLPEDARPSLLSEVQGFIAQEATHRRIHGLFNAQLAQQGLVNHWHARAEKRQAKLLQMEVHPLVYLGITVAYEHYTAVLADWTLRNPEVFEIAPPALKAMWLWHSAEEVEHKAVAFELYQQTGGGLWWRRYLYASVSLYFMTDALRQTCNNLWHDGALFKPSTWLSGFSFFFGRKGAVWSTALPLLRFFRSDFHPNQEGERARSAHWLQGNTALWQAVSGRAA